MGLKDFLRFGPPKDDADETADSAGARQSKGTPEDDGPQHGWTAGANAATKVTVGVLWLALIAGPVALGLRVFVPAQAQISTMGEEVSAPGDVAAVSAFAERALLLWLETPHGGTDDLELVSIFGDVEQVRPRIPWTTDNITVADVELLDNLLWSVTLSVDVTDGVDPAATTDEEGGKPPPPPQTRRMYFQIPVYLKNGALRAQALPAPVTAPFLAEKQEDAYRTNVGSAHPAFASVTEFLTALLTSGSDDKLERYTTPGSSIEAIAPAPFSKIQVTDLQATTEVGRDDDEPTDGQRLEVLATVRVIGANQQSLTSQYAISLLARQGRWEIEAVRDSPELRTPINPTATPTDPPRRPGDTRSSDEPEDEPTGTSTDETEPEDEPTGTSTDETEPPADEETGTEPPADEPPADEPPADEPAAGGGENEDLPATT